MKKILLLICMVFVSVNAYAVRIPKHFKNPIFNNVLWAANLRAMHNQLLKPTYAYDLNFSEYDRQCEYLDEDEKAVFLKCTDSKYKDIVDYEMFFIKYQSRYTDGNICNVWNCTFDIKDSKIDYHLELYSTDLPCPDEPIYPRKIGTPPEKIDPKCMEELRSRGWQKYLPVEDQK